MHAVFFKFTYLLRAMKRDPEHYIDEYLEKLQSPEVFEIVHFRKQGKNLVDVAQLCNDVANELDLADDADDADDDYDDGQDADAADSNEGKGRSGGCAGGHDTSSDRPLPTHKDSA